MSYRRNVAKQVTGPYFPTCFPSALEQVTPNYGYRPHVYRDYQEFIEWIGSMRSVHHKKYSNEIEEAFNGVLEPLGGLACKDIVFRRATSPLSWMRIVKGLLRNDQTVIADVGYQNRYAAHAVGIVPVSGDLVTLVSNHVPTSLQGVIPLQRVAEKMSHITVSTIHDPAYPFMDANITAIPKLD